MNDIPRRIRIDLMNPAEKLIYESMLEVEKMGCDIRLTEAITLLSKAKDMVSDVIDQPCMHEWVCETDTDEWSSYRCKKCPEGKVVNY